MNTQNIVKAFSVALLLSSVIPAFGMGAFKRLGSSARLVLMKRPNLNLMQSFSTARTIAKRPTFKTVRAYQTARPTTIAKPSEPTRASNSSWTNWFKKPFVAVASFLGFGCATTQPALAQADNLKTDDNLETTIARVDALILDDQKDGTPAKFEDKAKECVRNILLDERIVSHIDRFNDLHSRDAKFWKELPAIDAYVIKQCALEKCKDNQCYGTQGDRIYRCAALRQRVVELLAAEASKKRSLVVKKMQTDLWQSLFQEFNKSDKSIVLIPQAEIWNIIERHATTTCNISNPSTESSICKDAIFNVHKQIQNYIRTVNSGDKLEMMRSSDRSKLAGQELKEFLVKEQQ